MATWNEKMRIAREAKGLNKAQFAKLVGVSAPTVTDWESGKIKKINAENASRACEVLGITTSELMSHSKPTRWAFLALPPPEPSASGQLRPIVTWESPDDLPEGQYLFVPRRRVRLSAGNGRIAFEEESAPPLAFESNWVRSEGLRFKNLVVVYADGDSMEPQIRNGDVLLLNLASTEVRDGNVYALRCADHIRVKRLFRQYDGALILRSDNPEYPDETVPPADQDGHVSVIGEVIWRGGKMARSKA